MPQVFWHIFKDAAAVARSFAPEGEYDDHYNRLPVEDNPEVAYPTDAEVRFAWYSYEDYSGRAFVLFERAGVLYENHGSHCSCYGLEGQWTPEPTTWAALAMHEWKWMFRSDDEEPLLPEQLELEALIASHQ